MLRRMSYYESSSSVVETKGTRKLKFRWSKTGSNLNQCHGYWSLTVQSNKIINKWLKLALN